MALTTPPAVWLTSIEQIMSRFKGWPLFLSLLIYWTTHASLCRFLFLTRSAGIKFYVLALGVMDFYFWEWSIPVVTRHNTSALCFVIISTLRQRVSKRNHWCMCLQNRLIGYVTGSKTVHFEFEFQFAFEYWSTNAHFFKCHHWLRSIAWPLYVGY